MPFVRARTVDAPSEVFCPPNPIQLCRNTWHYFRNGNKDRGTEISMLPHAGSSESWRKGEQVEELGPKCRTCASRTIVRVLDHILHESGLPLANISPSETSASSLVVGKS